MPGRCTIAHMAPSLSVCLIVKNEEQDLERCLDSLRPLTPEIVVVDTGSTDRTPEIALECGARVIRHAWDHDFSAARNVGIDAATGDWILILDADETVPAAAAVLLPGLLAQADAELPPIDGYLMLCHNLMPPGSPVAFTEHPTLRLFRNRPAYRFRQAVHEQILPALYDHGARVAATEARILHFGYMRSTVQGQMERDERDRALLQAALDAEPDNVDLLFQLGSLEARQGNNVDARAILQRVSALRDHLGPVEKALTTFYLSNLELHDGNLAAAVQYAEASIAASTHSSPSLARLNLAAAHLRLGQAATQAATQALRPGLPPEAYGEALIHIQTGRAHFSVAHDTYRLVAAAPDLAEPLRLKASASLEFCARLLR